MDSTSPYAPLCQKVKKEINKRQKKECVETNTSVAQPLIHARTLSSQKHVLLFVPWDENCRSGGNEWGSWGTASAPAQPLLCRYDACTVCSSAVFLLRALIQARGKEPASHGPK